MSAATYNPRSLHIHRRFGDATSLAVGKVEPSGFIAI